MIDSGAPPLVQELPATRENQGSCVPSVAVVYSHTTEEDFRPSGALLRLSSGSSRRRGRRGAGEGKPFPYGER